MIPQNNSLFVDTSGWPSYLHTGDPFHDEAACIFQAAYMCQAVIVTTDHVLARVFR